jgi:hypothetical protein
MASAMSYSSIDAVIQAWVKKHRFTLFDRTEGMDGSFRSIYVSSEKGECFQIWIDPPESGRVAIHAADVETHLNETLRQDWSVPIATLEVALENALTHVKAWMNRQ